MVLNRLKTVNARASRTLWHLDYILSFLETPAQASIVPLSSRRLFRLLSCFSSGDLVRARLVETLHLTKCLVS